MFARFLLILAVLGGLALGAGPARDLHRVAKTCACCPTTQAMPCCTADHTTPPSETPAPSTPTDFKQAVAPAHIVIGISPQLTVELPSRARLIAARKPAPARLALLCTRLI